MAEEFKPGEKCKHSGIYKVTHDSSHVSPHEVTVVFGEPFPPCRGCGGHPRFLLVRQAQHVVHNEHFK